MDTEKITSSSSSTSEQAEDVTSKDYYFDSYSHFGIHEEMLKDSVRTQTYQQAILQNAHIFKGKTVLDIGCGTGILCMFASQAGAGHVYGIECSRIANQAKEIIRANGFEDNVTIIQGKVEEINLPVDKVDIIISEWMGYFLLYESMLDTVLFARDKWLVDGGIMLPDKARMYLCAVEDGEYKKEKIEYWDNVYGFDFSCIKEMAVKEPLIDEVDKRAVISDSCLIFSIDLNTVKQQELNFEADWKLEFTENDFCHAIVGFFDVAFTHLHKSYNFSTAPWSEYTHWKQTVFYLDEALVVYQNDSISGSLSCTQAKGNKRDLDVVIKYDFDGKHGSYHQTMDYKLR
eukprot:TRINITY_DN7482_c0_g1_i1.p1 TRINITY_DN7482_c0_g1~~TRINITY_DN7482_c0_g1_i1.p1  ORF type:complete len:345 (-),score=116.48 TRINITY_DN7482_c0_g1_i1:76-1110(-)